MDYFEYQNPNKHIDKLSQKQAEKIILKRLTLRFGIGQPHLPTRLFLYDL